MKNVRPVFISLVFTLLLMGCGGKTTSTMDTATVKEAKAEVIQPTTEKPKAEKPKAEKPKPPETHKARITAVGDLMVHSWQYNEAYNRETGEYDFFHNFTDTKKYLESADITIGNLETVFAGEEIGYSDFPMFNTPDAFADAVADAGFDVLTTANNHCMDKKADGLKRTIDILESKGIDNVGTYKTPEDSQQILIKDVNGIKIAILSYTYGTNGLPVPEDYLVNIISEEKIRADIEKAKSENPDIIMVLPHLGNEYETYSRDVFKNWINIMFDAGADIILASHPHVLQPMEMRQIENPDGTVRTGFVIYSLGNFISSQTTPPRNGSIILNIDVEKIEGKPFEINKVYFTPIWTQFRNADNVDDFCVRSVYEMITLPPETQFTVIRQRDLPRIRDIHYETTKMYLDYDVPIEEIQDSYTFYAKEDK